MSKSNKEYKYIRLTNKKIEDDKTFYYVLWTDFSQTWEPEENISGNGVINYESITKHNGQLDEKIQNHGGIPHNKQALIYTRISNKHSTQEQHSLEHQKNNCFTWCLMHNILAVYYAEDNGVSGKNFKNKKYELGNISQQLVPNKHILVLNSVDRLGRDAGQCIQFLKDLAENDIDVYFVEEQILYNKDTPYNKINEVSLLLVEAENESNRCSKRIQNSINWRKSKGHHIGPAPFGKEAYLNHDGIRKLKINKFEDELIKSIKKLHKMNMIQDNSKKNAKSRSYNKIVNHFSNTRIRNRKITKHTIKRMLENNRIHLTRMMKQMSL